MFTLKGCHINIDGFWRFFYPGLKFLSGDIYLFILVFLCVYAFVTDRIGVEQVLSRDHDMELKIKDKI